MLISSKYQGKLFSDYVQDMYSQKFLKIPFLTWENGEEIIITRGEDYHDSDTLRWFLKIFDIKYPKHENGEPYSFAKVNSKVLTDHLEYYRLVLAHNGTCFKSDDDEWNRTIELYNR